MQRSIKNIKKHKNKTRNKKKGQVTKTDPQNSKD